MHIDIAIPTKSSGAVIGETLDHAAAAIDAADVTVNQLIIVDAQSDDDTLDIAQQRAMKYGWDTTFASDPRPLPKARERAIGLVESDWFWFLDDDVRVREDYPQRITEWTANDRVGAIQGRKDRRDEHPTEWARRRARRGGTHATLIRTDAVRGVSIPSDVTVLEDEYLRRRIEAQGYRWVMDHDAVFAHDCQDRHPIGWTEGRVAGQYGLKPFHEVALNVPFALATGRNPIPHAKRALGWLAGKSQAGGSPEPTDATVTDRVATDGGER